jgi:predicted ATPase
MQVKRLHIEGYRSIRSLDLELDQLNVVVGPNGCGKTNLYRAMCLLHAAASGGLAQALAEEGGMPSTLWAGPREKKSTARIELGVEFDMLAFEFSLGLVPHMPSATPNPFQLDPDVKEERLWVLERKRRHNALDRKAASAFVRDVAGDRVTFPFELWSAESILSQLAEPHRFPLLSAVRSELLGWRFYHHFPIDAGAPARQTRFGIRTPVLAQDGRDLAAALLTIFEIGDARGLEQAVGHAFPGSTLDILAEAGRFSLQMAMPGLQRPLEARELSDGMLRYLCLLAVLMSPRPPPLLALNEPETSLHPELIEPLAALIVTASKRSQIWVTTHSAVLAKYIERASRQPPVRLEKWQGATRIVEEADSSE